MLATRQLLNASTRFGVRTMGRYLTTSSRRSGVLSLVGLGINQGQPLLGPDKSPEALRRHGLTKLITDLQWRLEQIPDFQEEYFRDSAAAAVSVNARNCNSGVCSSYMY